MRFEALSTDGGDTSDDAILRGPASTTHSHSRWRSYLIACEALSTTKERYAFGVFERAFQDYGLPRAMRTDNGVAFATVQALYGLSQLSVVVTEATRPPSANVLQQQGRFRH